MTTKKIKNLLIILLSLVVVLFTCLGVMFSFTNNVKANESYTIDYSKITTTKDLIKDYRGGTSFTPGTWEIVHTDLSNTLTSNFSLKFRIDLGTTWGGDPAWYGSSILYFRFFGSTQGVWDDNSSDSITYADDGFMFKLEPKTVSEVYFEGGEIEEVLIVNQGFNSISANNNFILEVGSYDIGDGNSVIYGKIDDTIFAYGTFATGTYTLGRYVSIGASMRIATCEDSSRPSMIKTPHEDVDVIPYDDITVYDVIKDFNNSEAFQVVGALNTFDLSDKINSYSNVALRTRIYTGNMYNIYNQRYFHFFAQDGSSGVPATHVPDSTGVLIVFYNDEFHIMMVGGDDYYSETSAEWTFIDALPNVSAERDFDVLDVSNNTYVDIEVGTFSVDSTYDAIYVKVNEYIVRLRYFVKGTFALGDNFTAKVDDGENYAVLESAEASVCKIIYKECENGYVIGEAKVFAGQEVTVKLIPNTGYKPQSLSLNGTLVNMSGIEYNYGALNIGEYTFTVSERTEILANFVIDEDCELAVYDYLDISNNPRLDIENVATIYTFGQMPKTTNAAYKMIFNPGFGFDSAPDAQRQFGFFQESGYPLWSESGFEISFYWHNSANFKLKGWGHDNVVGDGSREAYLAPGVEALVEMGHVDVDETYGYAYVKIDNYLIICKQYEKANYSIGTGVGGLYISSGEDINEGSIYIRTSYEFNNAQLATEGLKNDFSLINKFVVKDKPLEILAGVGVVIDKVILKDASNQVVQEFTGSQITKNGASYFVTPSDIGAEGENVLVDFVYSVSEIDVNFVFDSQKLNVLSANKVYLRDDYTLRFTTNIGYVLDTITLNGVDVTDKVTFENGEYVFVERFVEDDINFAITTKQQTYTVSASLKAGCVGAQISVDTQVAGNQTVGANGQVSFEVGIEEGYIVKKVTLNGQAVYLDSEGKFVVERAYSDLVFEVETEEIVSNTQVKTNFFTSLTGQIVISVIGLTLVAAVIFVVFKLRQKNNRRG